MKRPVFNHTVFNIRGGYIMLIEGNVLCTFILLEKPNYFVRMTRSGRTA
jgi:hypothetical protein